MGYAFYWVWFEYSNTLFKILEVRPGRDGKYVFAIRNPLVFKVHRLSLQGKVQGSGMGRSDSLSVERVAATLLFHVHCAMNSLISYNFSVK